MKKGWILTAAIIAICAVGLSAEGADYKSAAMGASVESAPTKEGTVLGDYAWYAENSEMTTHPVGTKLPNALGIFDMMGNVGEWCGDWFEREPAGGTQADPKGPDAGKNRVMRGGAFNSRPAGLAVAFRLSAPPWLPGTRNFIIGFRVVRQ